MITRFARISPRFCLQCQRFNYSTAPPSNTGQLKKSADRAVAYYYDVIGITEVTKAKENVIECEARLSDAQLIRRQKQYELRQLQSRLKDIHSELDRTPRGDDRYLYLITEEHAAIKKENALLQEFEQLENAEREAFHELSNKVRISHEKEREREERTKYWSLTASLVGAILGILGATISNEIRMRNLRRMMPQSKEINEFVNEISQLIHKEQTQISQFLTEMKGIFSLDSPKLASVSVRAPDGDITKCLADLRKQNEELSKQMAELKRLTALDQALSKDPNAIVYVGDEMELLLRKTEENIESKMKLQTLIVVVVSYALIGITAPLLYLWYTSDL